MTDAQLIEHYQKIQVKLAELKEAFTKESEPYEESLTTIETELMRRLHERGAQNTKTEFGTAYLAKGIRAKVTDVNEFLKFLVANWATVGKDMIDLRCRRDPVKDYLASAKADPPGVETEAYVNLNVRRT